jgi:hypothetical protein
MPWALVTVVSTGGVVLLVGAVLGWALASSVGGDASWWAPFVVLYVGGLMVWLPLRYRRRAN